MCHSTLFFLCAVSSMASMAAVETTNCGTRSCGGAVEMDVETDVLGARMGLLQIEVQAHVSPPAAMGKVAEGENRLQTTWTDWAYPGEGAPTFEAGTSVWETAYLRDKDNPLLNVTLHSPATVPNPSVRGVEPNEEYTDAYWSEYNRRMEAYEADLVVENHSALFRFSTRDISEDETKDLANGSSNSSQSSAGVSSSSAADSTSGSTPASAGAMTEAEKVAATEHAVAAETNVLSTGYGAADGVDNSPLLQSYWDVGSCGAAGDDHNADWCGGTELPPKCDEQVLVAPEICKSQVATLVSLLGEGWKYGQAVVVNGCKYAYIAQYKCVPVPMEG